VIINSFGQVITNYTSQDGLINNFVECVAIDANDNIWFGTAFGISMFNGSSWISFDQSTHPLMLSNDIKAITATSNGDIWIGTDYGVNQLIDGTTIAPSWQSYTVSTGLANNKVTSIDEAPNGEIWFAHSSFSAGVSVFDGSLWNSYSSPDLPISGVCATSFDSNGDKWFASPLDGVIHFDDNLFTEYTISDGLVSNYSTAICVDNNDHKWIGSGSGMTQLNASNSTFIKHTLMYLLPPPDTLNPVVEIAQDSWGRIWTTIYVGYLAEGGIAFWNGSQWIDYDQNDGIVGPNVKGLAIDSKDNVWIATSTGVSKISTVPNYIYDYENNDLNILFNFITKEISVNLKGDLDVSFKIYNTIGALVYAIDNATEKEISLSHFKPGVYYAICDTGNKITKKKFIIN
jgi:ligand-binding sensor domain-containing protein